MRLLKLPADIYEAFFRDAVRLYRAAPPGFRPRFWAIFAVQLLLAFMETSSILVISFFAMSLSSPEAVLNNPAVRGLMALFPYLADRLHGPRSLAAFASLLAAAFIFIKNIVSYAALRLTASLGEDLALNICLETMKRYLSKDYYWHLSPASGEVVYKMSNRASLAAMLTNTLMLYSNVVCALCLFVSLFMVEPHLTILVMGVFGLVSIGVYAGVRRRIDRAGQSAAAAGIKEQKAMHAATRNIREVILYRQQGVFLESIRQGLREGAPGKTFIIMAGMLPSWLLEAAGFATICGTTVWMIWAGREMSDIIQAASMLMLTAWRVLPAVNRVVSLFVGLRGLKPQALPCLSLLETFMTESPPSGASEPDPDFMFRESLALEGACFRYPGRPEDSLSDISLAIGKGEKIGFIGPSGAGKSTLALLLSGLVSPRAGRFKLDGREPGPAERSAYLRKIGFVPQSPMLMGGTVADNVAFSRWGRPYDREEVLEACRQAAMDFIQDPPGLDRVLSEGGAGLSGGQAQRVAIARALFARPDIIIFDEATSALDQGSESLIAEAIARLPGETTALIIAHRLSTVENCDRLVWLENGRVKAEGPAAEILPRYQAALARPDHGLE